MAALIACPAASLPKKLLVLNATEKIVSITTGNRNVKNTASP